MRFLLIGSDRTQSGWLAEKMEGIGFVARLAQSSEQALANGMADDAAAVLLDSGLSASASAPVVRQLRQGGVEQPLIVLSARGDWRDKVECLDAGADDFLLKPVRSEEIAARLRALIRRGAGKGSNHIRHGGLDLDLQARCAWLDGSCLNLTRNEFRLLRLFMLHPQSILSHSDLLDQLNPGGARPSINAAEVQIARLRRKIGAGLIRTVRGVGYRFDPTAVETGVELGELEPCRSGRCCGVTVA